VEIPAWFHDAPGVAASASSERFDLNGLIVTALHVGLVVEGVDVAGAAVHEEKDDAFCFGSKVGLRQSGAIGSLCCGGKKAIV